MAYWRKISRQKTINKPPEYIRSKDGYLYCIDSSVEKNKDGKHPFDNNLSLSKDHQEFLNPLTKEWRESLRKSKYKFSTYSSSPRDSNKHQQQNEKRKISTKKEVLQVVFSK